MYSKSEWCSASCIVVVPKATDEEGTLNKPDSLVFALVMPNQVTPTPVERLQQLLKGLQTRSETLSEEEK